LELGMSGVSVIVQLIKNSCRRIERNTYEVLVGKPEGDGPFRKPRHR
jgi:hypothetical protein